MTAVNYEKLNDVQVFDILNHWRREKLLSSLEDFNYRDSLKRIEDEAKKRGLVW